MSDFSMRSVAQASVSKGIETTASSRSGYLGAVLASTSEKRDADSASPAAASLHVHRAGIGLAFGAMGLVAASQTMTILLLRFLTDSIAISAALASALIAVTHFYDAIIDPSVGHASDRTRTRWGRRRPYLFIGTLTMPLSLFMVFNAPAVASGAVLVGYIAVLLLLHATGASMYKVPYIATSTELSDDYHTRSRLMAFRVAGNSIGLLLGSTIPSWTLAHWGASRASYGEMAWIVAGVVLLCCLAGTLLLPKERSVVEPTSTSLRELAKRAWANKPFRTICAAHACFMVGVATGGASNALFTRHVLQASDGWLGMFYVIMIPASLAAVPFWLKASRRYDKKPTYIAALAFYGLMHVSWLWADSEEPMEARVLRVILIGFALGGVMLLAFSMTADVIRYDEKRTGQRSEGTLCGIQSVIDRVFSVIGIVIMGTLLSALGYAASSDDLHSQQSDSAIAALYITFSILPALTAFLGIAILSSYQLSAEQLGDNATAIARQESERESRGSSSRLR